ncbi:MAG: GAF and ANTAR domain-containing protein [Rhodococcus sp. (in: high G+C Gram-positive bacteria)]|nr:GAF and ANTAR domain-containing protein [Rhodococcus sp. (in: high G+C Gram-positive bacteria)]MDI6626746.1 GAF and ANTAR domain-containing protein [Rhodococcus sp. (in: high G+C Gram-positive bacteria)]
MSQSSPDVHLPGSSPASSLAEFARSLRDTRRSMPETMTEILRTSIRLIPGATVGCVTTVSKGVRTVVASTDPLAEKLCRLQYELDEGPIPTEVRHFDVVVSDDLTSEPRWPEFAVLAVNEGFKSLAAFQLYSNADDLGALIFYSDEPRAFDVDAVEIGEALAAHAAIALLSARDNEQFRTGLASRDIIGQAKGMIMERYDLDAVQAFELLAKLSQQQNQPLHKVAHDLVDTDHPTNSTF